MENRRYLIWVMFIPLLIACGLSSLPQIPFSPKPFVEGIWVPTDYTLEYMSHVGYKFSSHSIEFASDGTVVVTNIPLEWIFAQDSPSLDLYSGLGNWLLIGESDTLANLRLNVHISSPGGDEVIIELGTVFDSLHFFPVNEPEEVNWVTFQKCYPQLHISDNMFDPIVKALYRSKRDTLGFSPITIEDRIEIDGTIGTSDIWMHSYTDYSSHDIFFRFKNNEYIWVFEQESIIGLATWSDYDGATWEETILLQYQTEEINGGPVNSLMIDYIGPDPRLTNKSDNWYLSDTIDDVLIVLEEWRQWRTEQPPSPQSLCP